MSLLGLPKGVSGITMPEADVGPLVVVNSSEVAVRRLFSLAHEFGHVLMHRGKGNFVSRDVDKSILEVQANAFAANFLVPAEGVTAALEAVGKQRPGAGVEPSGEGDGEFVVVASREPVPSIRLQDVVRLANHFGVSRPMMIYRLLNLRSLKKAEAEALLAEDNSGRGRSLERMLGLSESEHADAPRRYVSRIASLALEAYDQRKITRGKLHELVSDVLEEDEAEAFMVEAAPDEDNDVLVPAM